MSEFVAEALAADAEQQAAAEAKYLQILKREPDNIDALLGLFHLAEEQDQHAQALQWLRSAWQVDSSSVEVGILLIQRYLGRKDRGNALAVARTLRQQHPDDASALRALGLALLVNDVDSEAVATFRKLTASQPHSAEAWYLLALGLARTEDTEKEVYFALDQALAQRENYLPAQVLLAQLYLNTERFDSALQTARKIQRQDAGQQIGHRLEGDIFMRLGDFAQAASAYQAAYQKSPSAQGALLLSNVQRLSEDHAAALNTLRTWLAVEPQNYRVRLQLAMYLDQRGRQSEAIAEYEHVLEHSPDNVFALNNLAWHYRVTNQRKSLDYGQRAFALAPEQAEVLDTFGWILVRNKKPQQGLRLIEKAAAKAPHIIRIRYHLAVARKNVGQFEQAKADFKALLASGEQFPERKFAERLLQQLSQTQ